MAWNKQYSGPDGEMDKWSLTGHDMHDCLEAPLGTPNNGTHDLVVQIAMECPGRGSDLPPQLHNPPEKHLEPSWPTGSEVREKTRTVHQEYRQI